MIMRCAFLMVEPEIPLFLAAMRRLRRTELDGTENRRRRTSRGSGMGSSGSSNCRRTCLRRESNLLASFASGEKEFEDLNDLLVSFKFYFVIVKNSSYISIMYYLLL
jgi:hypothetical protein